MKFGKNAFVGNKWTFIELTDTETGNALRELKTFNRDVADNLMGLLRNDINEAEKIMLDKMLMSSFTYLSIVLDRKIESIRQEKKKEYYKYQDAAKANLTQKQPENTITGGKSMIEQVFESKES